jgi:hypothetical protein
MRSRFRVRSWPGTGGIQVARQRIQVGFPHAGKIVTVELDSTTLRIIDQHGELLTTVPRASRPHSRIPDLANEQVSARSR